MRIIAGEFKRTLIPSPPGGGTRPTTDRMRESIFSVIESTKNLASAAVLDLYAGSGILTWEALSRGAGSAIMVDSSAEICRHLRGVATQLGVGDRVQIIRADALAYIPNSTAVDVGLVFADPPYALKHCNSIIGLLGHSPILADGAVVVLEHGDQEFVMPSSSFSALWHGTGGASVVDILHRVSPMA